MDRGCELLSWDAILFFFLLISFQFLFIYLLFAAAAVVVCFVNDIAIVCSAQGNAVENWIGV